MAFTTVLKRLATITPLLFSALSFAEDIDLFQGGAPITGNKPNILIFVDNSSNWDADFGEVAGKKAQHELNALKTVIGTLTSDVRIGVMFFVKGTAQNPSGGYVRYGIRDMNITNKTALQNILDGIYPFYSSTGQKVAASNTQYGDGLYEVYKYFSGATAYAGVDSDIATNSPPLRDFSGNGSPTEYPHTAGSIAGNALAGASATQYNSPLSAASPCAKNYLIFIGNGFPPASTDPTTYGDASLASFNASQIYDENLAANQYTYADEWTRFLYQHGTTAPCSGTVCANSKLVTYSIDVYDSTAQQGDLPSNPIYKQHSLLKSMAIVGGGKYFAVSNTTALETALQTIFNEVQAVNSVFTSASLPVSVNTQGTYLNQIYMGVFRPDGAGAPRWKGNLKQYKFGLTTDATGADTIFLADANGLAAVNTQTGFVSPNAQSYWTTAIAPACTSDPTLGFWCYSPSGVGADKDLPDGDLVEKGAAAQKLRVLGPTARTMYTCTPDCVSGSVPALWATSNTALTASTGPLAGASANITSLTRSGPTVSVTTATDLGLASPTDTVTISASSVPAYNTSWTATKVDGTHFTFTVTETPTTPATGSAMTAAAGAATTQYITSGSAMTMSGGVVNVYLPSHGFVSGQSVTIAGAKVSSGSGYGSSDMATASTKCSGWVTGADQYKSTPCEYNGTFTITRIDDNNFSYTPVTTSFGSNSAYVSPLPTSFVAALGTITLTCRKTSSSTTNTTLTITGVARTTTGGTSETVTVTVANAGVLTDCKTTPSPQALALGTGNGNLLTGATIGVIATIPATINSNAANALNGTYTLTAVSGNNTAATTKTFTFVVNSPAVGTTTITPAATAIIAPGTANITATGQPTRTVTAITRTAGNSATVTVTTAIAHGFTHGSSVTIAGAAQPEYNGTFTITAPSSISPSTQTFDYQLTTGPAISANGGTVAKGSAVDASTLINWVRGTDNKEDENADGSLADVRASIHGDVLHSRPVVINYGGTTGIYAFYGSNDGTLHAVKGGQASTDGTEVWSFVAPEHYTKLGRLYLNKPLIKFPSTAMTITPTPTKRDYFFDGNIGAYQSADLTATHIFVSMRRGGRGIYALDVSSPTAPQFLWKKFDTDTGFAELGQTWAEPKVIPIRKTAGVACKADTPSTFTRALVFGAGYDATEEDKDAGTMVRTPTMGRGIFVVDAANGSLIKEITLPGDTLGRSNSSKRYSVPSDVTVLDTDGDGCIDRLYVGDTGANLFRVDIGNALPANWNAYKLAALGDSGNNGGSNDRKFLYPPDVVLGFIGSSQVAYILAGTGDREQPRSKVIEDRFYMVKDTLTGDTSNPPTATTVTTLRESDLTKVTDFSSPSSLDATSPSVKGWYIELRERVSATDPDGLYAGEKVVNAPTTVGGITFFGTNRPMTTAEITANAACTPDLGVARGYAINFMNGTAAYTRDSANPNSRTNLYSNFVGGGLPPSPVSGVVQINENKTVRFVIGAGGSGVEGSAIEGAKLQASPSSRRSRAFWYFRKDD